MPSKQSTERGQQRQLIILEAALDVFAESGYDGASLAAIAERSGVTQAGLLYHFQSKKALFARALDYREHLAVEHFGASAQPSALAALEKLPELMHLNQEDPRLLRLFVLASAEATNPNHPAHAWGAARYAWAVGWYKDGFRRDQEEGRVRPEFDPGLLAREIVAAMDGLNTQWLIGGQTFDMAEVIRDLAYGFHQRVAVEP